MKNDSKKDCAEGNCSRREFASKLLTGTAALALAVGPVAHALCASQPVATTKGPKIIAGKCIGCGKCAKVARKTFAMSRKTKKAYVKNPKGDPAPIIARAAKICPTKAITLK